MNKETFNHVVSPETMNNNFEETQNIDWHEMVLRLGRMSTKLRGVHSEELQNSTYALFDTLLNANDPGATFTEVRFFDPESLLELHTLSLKEEETALGDNYLHIVSYVSEVDDEDLAFELFVTPNRQFKAIPDMQDCINPNYNRIGKIAGAWIDTETCERRVSPTALAQLHDAHETLTNVFEMADIELPDNHYEDFQRALHTSARRR